jgi:hypothetical protein
MGNLVFEMFHQVQVLPLLIHTIHVILLPKILVKTQVYAKVCRHIIFYSDVLFNTFCFPCLVTSNRDYSYTLGTQNQSRWTVDSNNRPILTYTYGPKSVSISMICSTTGQDEFEAIGEDIANHYSMRLRSRCACWNGCGSFTPTTTTRMFFYSNYSNKICVFQLYRRTINDNILNIP